jgi:uncharacterized surface protein with fasciclin (FAS1) repeats
MRLITATLVALGLMIGSASPSLARPTIAQIASKNPNFTTLVTALKATGLVGVLNGRGAYTVFAPTNDAFAALPEGTVASLLKPKNRGKLKSILLYHVLGKRISAGAIPRGVTHVATLNGKSVRVRKGHSGVSVNGARVTSADIHASNGVIHVIDGVLLP